MDRKIVRGLDLWYGSNLDRKISLMSRTGLADQIIDELNMDELESSQFIGILESAGWTFHPEVGHFVSWEVR